MSKEKNRNINDDIKANQVYLIKEDWEIIWELSLKEAQQRAKEENLDLMEMWKKDKLTIVKLLDYWKFIYKQKKQDQKNKQKTKAPELKTLRITFKIWDNDILIRKKQAEKFASWWHPLKISLRLKWRENHYWDIAFEKIKHFVSILEDFYKLDWVIKKTWDTFMVLLKAKK